MKEKVTLTEREQSRLIVLNALEREEICLQQAADALELSKRQVARIRAAYREEGAEGLMHGNRGRRPYNALDPGLKERIITLAGERYDGFNHVHLTELLSEEEAMVVSRSSVRRLLMGAGIRSPRKRRSSKRRKRRERYSQLGMLLQIDGSRHDWLEGRGPWLTLLCAIDDATGEVHGAVFRDQEDAAGYLLLLRRVLKNYGVPVAVYHDRHGIFGRLPLIRDPLGRRNEPTQVERAFQELEIRSIAARSPQAKGRIERLFGTVQDRLVNELRLKGASSLTEANAYLPAFVRRFNERFRVPASEVGSSYRVLPGHLAVDQVCCFKYRRTVGADNTVRLGNHCLQLQPGHDRPSYARAHVEVHERLDGSLVVYYQGTCLASKPAPPTAEVLRARHGTRLGLETNGPRLECGTRPDDPPTTEPIERTAPRSRKPAADHPWRRSLKQARPATG